MHNNRKKNTGSLVLILLAIGLFSGALIAYFSDIVIGNVQGTVGTLDITGAYTFYLNGSDTPAANTDLENLNPGDYLLVKGTIDNDGSKSAWIRGMLELEGTLMAVMIPNSTTPVITVYEGDVDPTSDPTLVPLPYENNTVVSSVQIINGTQEIENAGVDSYDSSFTLYFSSLADNEAQGQTLELSVQTQAIQYRNNTETPTDAVWNTVVTQEFPSP